MIRQDRRATLVRASTERRITGTPRLSTLGLNRSNREPKEIIMNAIRHIRRLAGVLAGLAGVLLAFGATPAFAGILQPDPGGLLPHPPVLPAQVTGPVTGSVHTVVIGGMPGWQIALIAVTAALFAATTTIAVLADHVRAGRR